MAIRYIRSTDGNNADDGSTWALAEANLTGAISGDNAGDTFWISQAHSESTAGALTLTWAGTLTSPCLILCGDDSAEPPTALATTAVVATTTGTGTLTIAASSNYVYVYGITFKAGVGATATGVDITTTATGKCIFEDCSFWIATTGASAYARVGGFTGAGTILKNCTFKFANTGQGLFNSSGQLHIQGGSLLSGGSTPTEFVQDQRSWAVIDGFDFSNAAATMNLCNVAQGGRIQFRNCKLPASWSGVLCSSAGGNGVAEMFNCDSGDTNYRYRKTDVGGTLVEETTLVRTGGASDGTTSFSYKMVSVANAEYPVVTHASPEIVRWNDTTGSAITVTVEILRDSATNLTDKEIWLEVMYLGTSGVPLASFIDDSVADVLATAADQATSSETWTTTGMANPNKQKLSVTFTPQEKGFIHAVVKLAKASTTVYVDPVLTVT